MSNEKKLVLEDPPGSSSKRKSLIISLVVIIVIIVWAIKIADEAKTIDIPNFPDTSSLSPVTDMSKTQEKDKWEIGEVAYVEKGGEKTATLVAVTDKWSEPIMISRGQWFDFDWECSGDAEDGKMRMLITAGKNSEEYEGNCKDWIELDDSLQAPTYLKFRAEEVPTKVWVKIYPKY